ncbi:MAG: hypothetical protein RLN62_05470 [Rickettsiales bacterium]
MSDNSKNIKQLVQAANGKEPQEEIYHQTHQELIPPKEELKEGGLIGGADDPQLAQLYKKDSEGQASNNQTEQESQQPKQQKAQHEKSANNSTDSSQEENKNSDPQPIG